MSNTNETPGTKANSFSDLVMATADALREVPSCIMGVSGTDSFLAFLICSEAFGYLRRPDSVTGFYFCTEDDYLTDSAIPWLRSNCNSVVNVIRGYESWEDGKRWGFLSDFAVYHLNGSYRQDKCWLIGSRNKTERLLGKYSNSSRMVSFEPLYHIWKSEVMAMCKELNVPRALMERSYFSHCGCGDPTADTLAMNVDEVDETLQYLELTGAYTGTMDIIKAIHSHRLDNEFKANLPVRLPGPINVINVNPGVIKYNHLSGNPKPPLRVRQGLSGVDPICAFNLEIKGPSKIVYEPDNELDCGASVWIETDSEVRNGNN